MKAILTALVASTFALGIISVGTMSPAASAEKPVTGKMSPATSGKKKEHRIAIQIDQNDPDVMNLVLNNTMNIIENYKANGENVQIEVVAYGPGLHMLRADTSPVKDRIKQIADVSFPSRVIFSVCNNTKQGMEKREGHAITTLPQASLVPSGAVRLSELQEQGWSYLRP